MGIAFGRGTCCSAQATKDFHINVKQGITTLYLREPPDNLPLKSLCQL